MGCEHGTVVGRTMSLSLGDAEVRLRGTVGVSVTNSQMARDWGCPSIERESKCGSVSDL